MVLFLRCLGKHADIIKVLFENERDIALNNGGELSTRDVCMKLRKSTNLLFGVDGVGKRCLYLVGDGLVLCRSEGTGSESFFRLRPCVFVALEAFEKMSKELG